MKKWLLAILIMMLMTMSVDAEILLPMDTRIIGEEAFVGLRTDTVQLPDKLKRIEKRAFADSDIGFLRFPYADSVEYIAIDAFENANITRVWAKKDTIAYNWAKPLGLIPDASPFEDFTFKIKSDGSSEVARYNGSDVQVCVPETDLEGRAVTSIGWGAFEKNGTVEQIILPEGITSIEYYAFRECPKLRRIELPCTLQTVGFSAFEDDTGLESIRLPEGMTAIQNCTFSGCTSLWDVRLPHTLTRIENGAFSNAGSACEEVPYLVLPDNINYLDSNYALGSFVPVCGFDTATAHTLSGKYASFATPDSLDCRFRYINSELRLMDYVGSAEAVDVPKGVKVIHINAFEDNSVLRRVNLPEGLTTIMYGAFHRCANLSEIIFPSSLTRVENYAFLEAGSALETPLVLSLPDGITYMENSNTFSKKYQILTCHLNSDTARSISEINHTFALPDETDWRYHYVDNELHLAYYKGTDDETTVPGYIHTIDYSAFKKNATIRKVTVSEGVRAIEDEAFEGCSLLTEIYLPESLDTIGYAFSSCGSGAGAISYIFLPSNRTQYDRCLGLNNVAVCDRDSDTARALSEAMVSFTEPQLLDWRFIYQDGRFCVYKYAGSDTSVNVPQGVEVILDGAFSSNKSLVCVCIPEGVKEIGSAFNVCSSLSVIELPQSLQRIGSSAFTHLSGTKNDPLHIFLPDDITDVAEHAFSAGVSHYSFDAYPQLLVCQMDTPTAFAVSAAGFPFCTYGMLDWCLQYVDSKLHAQKYLGGDTSVYVPDGVAVFDTCLPDFVTDLYIPESVEEITQTISASVRIHGPEGSFAQNYANEKNLEFIPTSMIDGFRYAEVDGGVTVLGYTRQVEKLTLPKRLANLPVLAIAPEAFMGRTDIMELTFNCTELEEIGERACSSMDSLIQAYLPRATRLIGAEAFRYDTALERVRIGAETERIGDRAFADCPNLVSVYIPKAVTNISSTAFEGHGTGLVIYGEDGSYAESYANQKGIPFNRLTNDAYYVYDRLVSVNLENWTITLGPRTLPMADNFHASKAVKIMAESQDRMVLCDVEDGKVCEITCVADILQLEMIPYKTHEIIYEQGVYSSNRVSNIQSVSASITLQLTVAPGYETMLEDLIAMDVLRDAVTIQNIKRDTDSAYVQPSYVDFTSFVDAVILDTASVEGAKLGLGDSISLDVHLFFSHSMPPRETKTINVGLDCTYELTMNGISMEQNEYSCIRWSVQDKDYEAELEEQARQEAEARAKERARRVSEKQAMKTLESASSHVASLYALSGYLNDKQRTAVEMALSARIACLNMSADNKVPYCSDHRVFQQCRQLLNVSLIDEKSDLYETVRAKKEVSVLEIVVPNGKHGRTEIKLYILMDKYAYGQLTPFGSLGTVYADVHAEDGSHIDHQLITGTAWSKVSTFTRQMENLAEQAVKDAYQESWGNHANEVADILINQTLLKLIDTKYGSFSNGVFTVMWNASH